MWKDEKDEMDAIIADYSSHLFAMENPSGFAKALGGRGFPELANGEI